MKTKENFEGRRLLREQRNQEKNSKIKKETADGVDGQTVITPLKQEPDEWVTPEAFEWDAENPNNFLDATMQVPMS